MFYIDYQNTVHMKGENFMDQRQLEYGKLSGVEIPSGVAQAVAEAQGRLSNLVGKKGEMESERAALETEIRGLVSEEVSAVVDGGDTKKLSGKRKKAEERRAELGLLLAEIDKLEVGARSSLSKVEEELAGFINDRLAEGRVVLKAQLEQVMEERGRNLNQVGQIFSTLPKETSRSRIAVCEICIRDLGIFDPKTICQPVGAGHFEKLPRFEHPPFHPRAMIEYFKCPYCGKKPWSEHNLILTNAGFFCVPEKKEGKKNG
jgi:hypothetical protein